MKQGGTRFFRETWRLKNGKWKELKASKPPVSRNGAFMFFHPGFKQVILYGGYKWSATKSKEKVFSDLWRFDGKRWIKMLKKTGMDDERIFGHATYDSKRDRIVVMKDDRLWQLQMPK